MNKEEFKKYVDGVNNNIENLLKDNEKELSFYQLLTITFNQVCNENRKLEQALDDIKKICNSIPIENSICDIGKIHDIEVIIQKAKGDVKDENNNV